MGLWKNKAIRHSQDQLRGAKYTVPIWDGRQFRRHLWEERLAHYLADQGAKEADRREIESRARPGAREGIKSVKDILTDLGLA
jgi:hypothetical protein